MLLFLIAGCFAMEKDAPDDTGLTRVDLAETEAPSKPGECLASRGERVALGGRGWWCECIETHVRKRNRTTGKYYCELTPCQFGQKPIHNFWGSRVCEDCPVGTFSDEGLACTRCPKGRYGNSVKLSQKNCWKCGAKNVLDASEWESDGQSKCQCIPNTKDLAYVFNSYNANCDSIERPPPRPLSANMGPGKYGRAMRDSRRLSKEELKETRRLSREY